MMNFIKSHWGTIVSITGTLAVVFVPALNVYAAAHPHQLAGAVCAALVILFNSTAPKDKPAS